MSFFALVTGPLVANPQARQGSKARFATATLRVATDDEAARVSIIAFGEHADRLLEFAKGDALAVSGRAKLTSWVGRDGVEKHGLSVTVDQIAAAKPCPRIAAGPRHRAAGIRKAYSARRGGTGAPLRSDSVADLWTGPVP